MSKKLEVKCVKCDACGTELFVRLIQEVGSEICIVVSPCPECTTPNIKKIFREGAKSSESAETIANPYRRGTFEYWLWNQGFDETL